MEKMDLIELIDCSTWFERLRGLTGRSLSLRCQGLWLRPCRSIHTFTISYPISVAFVSANYRVLQIHPCVKRFRIRWHRDADSVIEAAPMAACNVLAYQSRLEFLIQQHLHLNH